MRANRNRGGAGRVGFWVLSASFLALGTLGLLAIIMRPAAAQVPNDLFYLPPDSEVDGGDDFTIPPDSDVIGLPPGEGIIDGPPVPAEVHFLFPNGTAKPAFCPRRKLPLEDEKALIVAGYYPPTEGVGTFTWSSTVQGGSVARAWEHDTVPLRAYGWFSSHTPAGNYGARVRYDKNGTSDQDDGGPIKVFDAELTFDGHGANDPDYTPEESPGFYMAREGPRKELALEFWPEDLSSYLPGGMPRIPPPIVITLSKSNEYVQLYSAPSGGQPVTNLHWGWEVGQGGPFWDEPPEHLYVGAAILGTCDLTLMLTYFQTWFPEPPIPTSISATDKVRVNVIQVDLQVNNTQAETDDYVVKEKPAGVRETPARTPAGATDNHMPLRAVLGGPPGTTCLLQLSDGGGHVRITKDGGAPLNAQGEPITVGTPLNLWVYGTSPSEALNDVMIEARTDKTGDAVCGGEDVTVVWFDEEDLHFRGSDHQNEPLTPGSTAVFTWFADWMQDTVGTYIYHEPGHSGWDISAWQMEIRCQPTPNVVMPSLTWDIMGQTARAHWGPGERALVRTVIPPPDDWGDDHPIPAAKDVNQDENLPSLFVIDAPGWGWDLGGLPLQPDYWHSWMSKHRNWVEVQIGGKWYVCSPYKQWHAIMHLKYYWLWGRWLKDLENVNELLPGGIDGFPGDWTDLYEQEEDE